MTADAAACLVLAAACSIRGLLDRSNTAGTVILAALCALTAPLVREGILRGSGAVLAGLELWGACSLAGALCGLAAAGRTWADRAFYMLDFLGVVLAGCLACFAALAHAGALAAGLIGMLAGLGPGVLRDTVLGAETLCLGETGYAASAAIAVMATEACAIAPARWELMSPLWSAPWLPAMCGACAGLLARYAFCLRAAKRNRI